MRTDRPATILRLFAKVISDVYANSLLQKLILFCDLQQAKSSGNHPQAGDEIGEILLGYLFPGRCGGKP